jgi:hypothetical protein
MAKSSGYFGLRRGSTKSHTFSVLNGQQITKDRVEGGKNPRTLNQMIQRCFVATIGQAYSALKVICDHSFEGMKVGRDTMGYFIAQNVQLLREKVQASGLDFDNCMSFLPLGKKVWTGNNYQVSMGSLPRIYALANGGSGYAKIAAIETNTYQGVIDALGLKRGDQLTFMVIESNSTNEEDMYPEFSFSRVILDPLNADGSQAALSSAFVDDGAINLPSFRNEGSFDFAFDTCLKFRSATGKKVLAVAVIASRQASDDKWLRSTAYLDIYALTDWSLQECIDMAATGVQTDIYAPNPHYLNNSGEGGTQTTDSEGGSDDNNGGGDDNGNDGPPPEGGGFGG